MEQSILDTSLAAPNIPQPPLLSKEDNLSELHSYAEFDNWEVEK